MPQVNFDAKKKRGKKADETKTTNPFVKAKESGRRLKLFLWGDTGTHKTILSLQFPNPTVIDLEKGTEHYGKDFAFHVADPPPATAAKVIDLVDWLGSNKHSYRTLVIDPITVLWEMVQKQWSDIFLNRNRQSKGFKHEYYDLQVKDWQTIKAYWKDFINKILLLDMNVIVTARQKAQYADSGFMKKVGETFDGEKTLPYMFDVVMQMYKQDDKFCARCIKDRTNHFKEGEELIEPSYATFEDLFGKGLSRKSKPVIEEKPEPEQKPTGNFAEDKRLRIIEDIKGNLKALSLIHI